MTVVLWILQAALAALFAMAGVMGRGRCHRLGAGSVPTRCERSARANDTQHPQRRGTVVR